MRPRPTTRFPISARMGPGARRTLRSMLAHSLALSAKTSDPFLFPAALKRPPAPALRLWRGPAKESPIKGGQVSVKPITIYSSGPVTWTAAAAVGVPVFRCCVLQTVSLKRQAELKLFMKTRRQPVVIAEHISIRLTASTAYPCYRTFPRIPYPGGKWPASTKGGSPAASTSIRLVSRLNICSISAA